MNLKILYADAKFLKTDSTLKQISVEQRVQGLALQQSVELLENVGHNVTITRTFQDALEMINAPEQYFDVAVIELGWEADLALEQNKRHSAGWDLCEAIENVNKSRKFKPTEKPTLKVICSDRLAKDSAIGITAANRGILPIYNQYNENTAQMLRAVIKFIESGLTSSPLDELARKILEEDRDTLNSYLNQPLADYKKWFNLTLVLILVSVVLLLGGIVGLFLGYVQLGILSSAISLVNGITSILLFRELDQLEKSVITNLGKAEEMYEEAIERVFKEMNTSTTSEITS